MDQATDIWTPHLQDGERLIWQAEASPKLRRAEIGRRRLVAVLIGLASAVLAGAFGYKLYETIFPGHAQPNLAAGVAAPLYLALALTFAAVFIAQLARLNPKLTPAIRYAATSTRLIALDAAGAIIDQLDSQDIAGLILGGRRATPDLFVLRSHDDLNVRAFSIEHIDKPFEAKTIIEQELLETSHEQAG